MKKINSGFQGFQWYLKLKEFNFVKLKIGWETVFLLALDVILLNKI
jgi:hypothetical protein